MNILSSVSHECAKISVTNNSKMMNSLPRWLGRKKSKDEKKPTIEISSPFAPVHRDGMSSISHSLASLNSLSSENENLYVNGQVPRGQFKEYFMPPESHTDHTFKIPQIPSQKPQNSRHAVTRAGSVRSHVAPVTRVTSNIVKRSSSIRSNVIVTNSFMNDKKFVRHGSGRSSHSSQLKKSYSMDDVLEESINKSLESEEPSNNYYNVQYVGKAKTTSQLILNRENLQQHDQIYMKKLGLTEPGQEPRVTTCQDPLATSYLGHTLLSQMSDKGEDDSDESKDSGAISMGGGKSMIAGLIRDSYRVSWIPHF